MAMGLKDAVEAAWRQAAGRFVAVGPRHSPAVLAQQWSACLEAVRDAFVAHLGPPLVEQRFMVPSDYATFMLGIGGGWHRQERLGLTLFSAPHVAAATVGDFERFYAATEEPDGPQDDGLWLRIGSWSDKHDYLICCDRAHRRYGVVLDAHDSHPWLNGADFAGCTVLSASFLKFLGQIARGS